MDIHNCTMCPRKCHADRTSDKLGFCNIDGKPHISEICIHKGEEPVLGGEKGVCNVFFSSCNLKCVFCQNYEISQLKPEKKEITDYQKAVSTIAGFLCQGVNTVGFVSPSHQIFQMKTIIDMLRKRGYNPTIIYNSNGYDDPETLREIQDYVDIYLPDYKYGIKEIGEKYSSAPNYPEIALKAIKEMYYQKGSRLELNDDGIAENGLIIRHLVLPNNIENSIEALKNIAYDISSNIHLSLMSQYYPEFKALEMNELNRTLNADEYNKIVTVSEELGMMKGWRQQLNSNENYRPDFKKEGNPFEK
ncbi:MAG: 4Fe-4S cluster-binding domain-containing protein [Bacteroidales bacterium]|nr:4Fe-4S cluster-binding domain-containing protein [Bacteroidales bacterium]